MFCGNCGNKLNPGDCWCGNCGTAVESTDYQNSTYTQAASTFSNTNINFKTKIYTLKTWQRTLIIVCAFIIVVVLPVYFLFFSNDLSGTYNAANKSFPMDSITFKNDGTFTASEKLSTCPNNYNYEYYGGTYSRSGNSYNIKIKSSGSSPGNLNGSAPLYQSDYIAERRGSSLFIQQKRSWGSGIYTIESESNFNKS